MTEKPKRVRVTADLPDRRPVPLTRGIALPGAPWTRRMPSTRGP